MVVVSVCWLVGWLIVCVWGGGGVGETRPVVTYLREGHAAGRVDAEEAAEAVRARGGHLLWVGVLCEPVFIDI